MITQSSTKGIFSEQRVIDLIANKKHKPKNMLDGLDTLLYEHVRKAITDVEPLHPSYNPFLYEMLLNDVSKSLDRCLSYRRECADLEAQAVRRALEFELFEDTYSLQLDLQAWMTDVASLHAQKEAYADSADGFGTHNEGFRRLYSGSEVAAAQQINAETNKKNAMAAILERVKEHQRILETRHTTPGHALNYVERRDRTISLILQDLVEAYQKARAAKAGLLAQLGIDSDPSYPFPVIFGDERDSGFLDAFVLWVRSIAAKYEDQSKDSVVFDLQIPIVSPWSFDSANKPLQLRTQADFDAAMASDGRLVFPLRDALPSDDKVKNLRVRAVGISVGVAGPFWEYPAAYLGRIWTALVFPPEQPDPTPGIVDTARPISMISRSPAIIGRVSLSGYADPPEMVSGAEVWNVDPRAGDWTVVIQKLVNWPHASVDKWPRSRNEIKDIKLHLRLIGDPSHASADWINS